MTAFQLPSKFINGFSTKMDLTTPNARMIDENEQPPQLPQERVNIPETAQKDKRGNARNFTQNECSMIRTKVSHLLAHTGIYGDKRAIVADYDAFLEKHNVKCNQLCLLFLYEYLRMRDVEAGTVKSLA